MGVRDENMPQHQIFGGERRQDRFRVQSGIEHRRFARDRIPDEIAIHVEAVIARRETPQTAPAGQVHRRGQPAGGEGGELLWRHV